jgi:hypothetical protein
LKREEKLMEKIRVNKQLEKSDLLQCNRAGSEGL